MDALDRDVLDVLRTDARLPYRSLGARVGLSANAAADRVRRLVANGVIRGFITLIDEAAGTSSRPDLLIDARLRADTDPEAFEAALTRLPWLIDELVRILKREVVAEATQIRLVLRTVRCGPC